MVRAQLTLRADAPGAVVSRHLFGHFAEHLGRCIYDGLWVGEESAIPNVRGWRSDVVAALRAIRIPNLRWPGGCFADDYHWRDGVGPRASRPRRPNAWWGSLENNAVGSLEFIDLCRQLGCEPYFCGNIGSGTVAEMRDWVEYLNAPRGGTLAEERAAHGLAEPAGVRLWAVGNESWGCGGHMRVEAYADHFRRAATYLRDHGDTKLFRVACGPRDDDYHWTDVMMRECAKPILGTTLMQGLALHYYCVPGDFPPQKSATEFGEAEWLELMWRAARMDEFIERHSAIMDRRDPEKKVALVVDEWGAWHAPAAGSNPAHLFQQNTLRDAVMAGAILNTFIHHSARVRLGNLAQVVNVIQAVILTDGPRFVLTPTWHVFRMFLPHHDAMHVPVELDAEALAFEGKKFPALSAAASRGADGALTLTVCNLDPARPARIETNFPAGPARGEILTAAAFNAHNTFDQPHTLEPQPFAVADARVFELPAHSVAVLRSA